MNLTNVNWDVHPATREILHIVDGDVSATPRLIWIQNWKGLLPSTR